MHRAVLDSYPSAGVREAMSRAAVEAKLPELPLICLKCKADRVWLSYSTCSVECARCGWTGFTRPYIKDDPIPEENTPERRKEHAHNAAMARLRRLTPEQLTAHMRRMKLLSSR